jgi:hypothetical protein
VNLRLGLQHRYGLGYLIIAHCDVRATPDNSDPADGHDRGTEQVEPAKRRTANQGADAENPEERPEEEPPAYLHLRWLQRSRPGRSYFEAVGCSNVVLTGPAHDQLGLPATGEGEIAALAGVLASASRR